MRQRRRKKAIELKSKLIQIVALSTFIFAFLVSPVSPHPGALDSIGGHQQGQEYHFHKGRLKGKAFSSKRDALKALNGSPQIRLASFNIRIFSNKSRSDQELEQICNILKEFDIVAIQELRDEEVMRRTKNILDSNTKQEWAYEISGPVGQGVKERYAFLYRKDRVLVVKGGRLVDDSHDKFIREPYYATFRAGHFDFTLLTIHVLYKSKDAPERKGEFDALAKVFKLLQEQDPDEDDLILMGDFNDSPDNGRFKSIAEFPGMHCIFQPPLKTTISDSSLYDNICFQKASVTEYKGENKVIGFDEEMFGNDDNRAKLVVSDHRPVYALFGTDRDDD